MAGVSYGTGAIQKALVWSLSGSWLDPGVFTIRYDNLSSVFPQAS